MIGRSVHFNGPLARTTPDAMGPSRLPDERCFHFPVRESTYLAKTSLITAVRRLNDIYGQSATLFIQSHPTALWASLEGNFEPVEVEVVCMLELSYEIFLSFSNDFRFAS